MDVFHNSASIAKSHFGLKGHSMGKRYVFGTTNPGRCRRCLGCPTTAFQAKTNAPETHEAFSPSCLCVAEAQKRRGIRWRIAVFLKSHPIVCGGTVNGMNPALNTSPDLTADRPPRPPRWVPLSVRGFVAMLALIALATICLYTLSIYHQHAAIREIYRLGGDVETRARGPGFWREPLFDEVVGIAFTRTPATDEMLNYVGGLTGLQELNLDNNEVTDAGLAQLEGLGNLEDLALTKAQVTDAGLVHLRKLTNLRTLRLDRTRVSDAGFVHLKGMTKLEGLFLVDTDITGEGLAQLGGMNSLIFLVLSRAPVTDAGLMRLPALPKLELLMIDGTRVTDAGLSHLSKLSSLQVLSLSGTQVTNDGLEHLQKLTSLRELDLSNTQVTDAGSIHLKRLSQLRALRLEGTQITDESIVELRSALPNVIIH
jgi:hypothetical protein